MMIHKLVIALLMLCVVLLSMGKPVPIEDALVLSPYLGYRYFDNNRDKNNAWELGIIAGKKIMDKLSIEGNLGLIPAQVKSNGDSKWLISYGLNALYDIANFGKVTPYILGGLGGDIGHDNLIGGNLGLGLRLMLNPYFNPRIEVKNTYYPNGKGNDTLYQLVFTWPPVKDDLEEAYQKNGKLEKLDMNITFDTGKTDVKPDFDDTLDQYAAFLIRHPELRLEIKGYTDNVGSDSFNRELSQKRANAVSAVLISKYGITSDRIRSSGHGDEQPVASNDTEEGRAKNRRIEASTN